MVDLNPIWDGGRGSAGGAGDPDYIYSSWSDRSLHSEFQPFGMSRTGITVLRPSSLKFKIITLPPLDRTPPILS